MIGWSSHMTSLACMSCLVHHDIGNSSVPPAWTSVVMVSGLASSWWFLFPTRFLFALHGCCKLSTGVALNVWFTGTGCARIITPMSMWHEQTIIEWLWHLISADRSVESLPILTCEWLNMMTSGWEEWSPHVITIIACYHRVKLCVLAARAFRSQQG